MLHMTKLCVGISDVGHLRSAQAARLAAGGELRHRTRSFPRRAAEVIDGGSLYWVIAGAMVVRQRVIDIVEDRWEDGSRCAGLLFDAALVTVAGRPTKPFQGWISRRVGGTGRFRHRCLSVGQRRVWFDAGNSATRRR